MTSVPNAPLPIDLERFKQALADLEAVMGPLDSPYPNDLPCNWMRMHYASVLAAYSMMGAEQQCEVSTRLTAVQQRARQLAH